LSIESLPDRASVFQCRWRRQKQTDRAKDTKESRKEGSTNLPTESSKSTRTSRMTCSNANTLSTVSSVSLSLHSGSISFLNFYQHIEEIIKTINKYCRNGSKAALILSLRYSQIIDNESLHELAYLTETLRREEVKIIFSGLHQRIIKQMEEVAFFSLLLQEEEKCMYSINTR
jgi:anti-anti-sigma regulatory factor